MGFFAVIVKLLLCLALTAAHLQHESDRETAKTKGGPFDINSGDGYAYQCSCQKVLKLATHPEIASGLKPHVSEEELIRDALQAKFNRKSKIEEIVNRNSELIEIEEGILDEPLVLTYQYPDQGDNVLVSVQPVPRVDAPIEESLYPASFEGRPVLDYFDLPVAQPVDFYYQPEAPIIEEIIVDGPDAPILNAHNIATVVNKQPIKKDTPEKDQPKVKSLPKTKPHPKGTKQSFVDHNSKPTVEDSPKSKPHTTIDAKHYESKPKSPNSFIDHGPATLEKPTRENQVHHDEKTHPIQHHRKVSGKDHYTKQPSQPQNNVSGKKDTPKKQPKKGEEGHESSQSNEKRNKGGKWAFTPGQQENQEGVHKKPTHIKQEKYAPQPAHSHNQASGKGHSSQKPDQPHRKASGKGHNKHKQPKDKHANEYGESHGSHPSNGKKKNGGKLVYSPGQQVHENGGYKKPIQKNHGGGEHKQPVHQQHGNHVHGKQPTPSHKKASDKGHYSHQPAHSHEKASGKGHYNEKHPKRSGGRHVEKHESHPKGKKKKGGKWIFTPGQQEVQKSAHDKHSKGKAKGQGEYAQGHHAPKHAKSHGHGKKHEKKEGHEVNHQSGSGHKKHPKKQTDGHKHQKAHGHQRKHGHKEVENKHPTDHGKEQKKKGHRVKQQPTKGEGYGQVHHGPKQPKGSGKGHGVSSHKEHGQQPGGKAKGHGKGQGGKGHELKHGSRYEKHPKGKSEGHGKYAQGYEGRNERKEHDKHPKKKAQKSGAKGTHRGNGHNEAGKDHSKVHGKNAYGAKHESGHNKQGHPKGKAKGQGQYVAHGHKAPSNGQDVKLASGKSGNSAAEGQRGGQYSESYDEEPFDVIKATPGKWTWQETDEEEKEDGGSQGESWSWSSEDSSDDKAADDGSSNGGHSWSWSSEDGGDSAAKSDASGSNEGYSGESKSWSSEDGGDKSGKKSS